MTVGVIVTGKQNKISVPAVVGDCGTTSAEPPTLRSTRKKRRCAIAVIVVVEDFVSRVVLGRFLSQRCLLLDTESPDGSYILT